MLVIFFYYPFNNCEVFSNVPFLFLMLVIHVFFLLDQKFINFMNLLKEPTFDFIDLLYYFCLFNIIDFCLYFYSSCFGFNLILFFHFLYQNLNYQVETESFNAINFPPSIALAASNKFLYVVFLFFVQHIFQFSLKLPV